MYEAEVNDSVESIETLPAGIRKRFAESRQQINERTTLPWGEHCTECNFPTCYTSCELYSPRRDGACRLFVTGMVRIDDKELASGYLIKIQFKRWGKLWTVGNLNLSPVPVAAKKERLNLVAAAFVKSLPLPRSLEARALQKVSYLRRRSAEQAAPSPDAPDCFLFECYNPNARTIEMTFTVRLRNQVGMAYQRKLSVPPGFVRERIPFQDISRRIDATHPFEVEIVPNDCENTVLYFGVLDFVRESERPAAPDLQLDGKQWKCIVWDLDNTLWNGILVEDGLEKIRIRQDVIDVIKDIDRRGILHSIASKNNYDEALKVLQLCGIDEFFLCPQINWQPKSESIARIAHLLNIGIDSIAFVDDQSFEREEVKAVHPQVTTIDAAQFATLPGRAECRVPVTEESRQRRQLYRLQEQRNAVLESHNGDYIGFLRECDIRLNIGALNDENIERVFELAQRTNQMNFSGNRYPRAQLAELIRSKSHETYVIRCEDRFGSYGIVGFAVVELNEPRLLDLMFSCRIQSKRIEHAFLGHLFKRFAAAQSRNLFANYRKTAKNAPSGKVFEEMGFEQVGETGGVSSLVLRSSRIVPDDGIVRIWEDDAA